MHNGGGTVRLTILDADYNAASQTLIDKVQTLIDPTGDAKGLGIAPIGHVVTVDTAIETEIDVTTSITLGGSTEWVQVKSAVEQVIKDYLFELKKTWSPNDEPTSSNLTARIAKIEAGILNINGVVDIFNTKLNGMASNLDIGVYEIPVFRSVVNS